MMVRRLISARGRLAVFAVALVAALSVSGIAMSPAQAAVPGAGPHAMIGADYKGWAYAIDNDHAATVATWKYATTGWQATTFPTGTAVYVYPWGSGWNWVYKNSAWYAMKSDRLAKWSCAVPEDTDIYPSITRQTFPVYRLNSTTSDTLLRIGLYDDLTLLCDDGFADAAGTATDFVLVRVTQYSTCVPFTIECVVNPVVKTRVNGYMKASDLSDWPSIPPDGEFGNLPD